MRLNTSCKLNDVVLFYILKHEDVLFILFMANIKLLSIKIGRVYWLNIF